MELTIKELAPYLPYELKFIAISTQKQYDTYDMISSVYSEGGYQYEYDFTEEQFMNMPLKQSRITFVQENNGEIYLGEMEHEKGFVVDDVYLSEVKPLLLPLSHLTKEIKHNGERFVPIDVIYHLWYENNLGEFSKAIILQKIQLFTNKLPYFIIQKMIECHFDVFGLIEQGLAINKSSCA